TNRAMVHSGCVNVECGTSPQASAEPCFEQASRKWENKKSRATEAALPVLPPLAACGAACSLRLQRHDPDLDATVQGAALFGAVVGHRIAVAEAGDLEALALQALADQVGGHVLRAFLGNALVDGGAADVVGMAADLDDGLVVLAQGGGDVVERRVELRLEFGAVEVEGHAVGEVELDGV